MKEEELAKFEEYKKEETRRLQKERRTFERHAAAARAIPDKKEREEIQVRRRRDTTSERSRVNTEFVCLCWKLLKQQLSSLQEELKGKESRWACTHNRLRQQTDSLRQENASLRDEVTTHLTLQTDALINAGSHPRDTRVLFLFPGSCFGEAPPPHLKEQPHQCREQHTHRQQRSQICCKCCYTI